MCIFVRDAAVESETRLALSGVHSIGIIAMAPGKSPIRDARSATLKLAAALFVIVTAACQTDMLMTKPGATIEGFFDDQSDCKEAAASPDAQEASSGAVAPEVVAVVKATTPPEQSVFDCMQARGWRQVISP